jgi:hypothetical protein
MTWIKKLYKKWCEWEDQEVVINFGYWHMTTNNYTIQIVIIIILLCLGYYK